MIVIGDPCQSDINGASGFQPMYDLFNSEGSREQGIYTLAFTKDDIVRSGILKHIVELIEAYRANNPSKH
jgi:hypothetical protein